MIITALRIQTCKMHEECENCCVSFDDVVYPVKTKKKAHDPILKSVSGRFSSGNLTAIIGRSGAGKTTLLNVLGGQISVKSGNLNGTIRINEFKLGSKEFKKTLSYLPQDVLLTPCLTVKESMTIAANLMLGSYIREELKEKMILNILKSLSLQHLVFTRTERLSGGEKKRLSVAIELINDPQVILFDEPTSGLDNVATKECIDLLKKLASRGKAVICSIHQPSDSIIKMFDHLYIVNDGYCIYDGNVEGLIGFLDDCGYPCPITYSPVDYILELEDAAYETLKKITLSLHCERNSKSETIEKDFENSEKKPTKIPPRNRVGLFEQTVILVQKNYIQLRRRKLAMALHIIHHLICSLIIGILALGDGKNAERTFDNVKLCAATACYFHFTYTIIPIILVPPTTKLIRMDIRNGWYSPLTYITAELFTILPSMLILCSVFSIIVYTLLFFEFDFDRVLGLSIVLVLTAFCGYMYGLIIGTIFNSKNGAIIGPVVALQGLILSCSGLGDGKVPPITKFLRRFSFLRYTFVGYGLSVYGGRDKLDCSEVFCRHTNVDRFFADMGLDDNSYSNQVVYLSAMATAYLSLYYLVLRVKYLSDFTSILKQMRIRY